MSFHRTLLLIALAVSTACSAEGVSPIAPGLRVERVVLVSVDGLRGDALAEMPSLAARLPDAVWTDRARSVDPAVTLPAHLSMLTGRDVTELGIVSNALDASTATALLVSGTSTVFDWLDGPSDAVVGASLLPAESIESARAFFALRRVVAVGLDDAAITSAALDALAAADAPDALFVHLPAVDLAGHTHGWITSGGALTGEYLAAVRHADAQIARLYAALAPEIAAGTAALIVTADHGGGHGVGCGDQPAEREHCTTHDGDQLVPLVVLAGGATARRLEGEPSITRVAPTIAGLLGATPPSGLVSLDP